MYCLDPSQIVCRNGRLGYNFPYLVYHILSRPFELWARVSAVVSLCPARRVSSVKSSDVGGVMSKIPTLRVAGPGRQRGDLLLFPALIVS